MRDRLPALIKTHCRQRAGGATGINRNGFPFRRHHQPEAVAAQPVHMRIDHRNGCGGGDHRFECAAAVAQYGKGAFTRQMMGGDDHALRGHVALNHNCSRLISAHLHPSQLPNPLRRHSLTYT